MVPGGGGGNNNAGVLLGQDGKPSPPPDGALTVIARSLSANAPGLGRGAGIASATGDIAITTDSIALDPATGIASAGILTIAPIDPNATIGLAGGAGSLNLDVAELDTLADGFASITIGDPIAGNGALIANAYTFGDPTTLAHGAVTVSNVSAGANPLDLIARAGIVDDDSFGVDATAARSRSRGLHHPGQRVAFLKSRGT